MALQRLLGCFFCSAIGAVVELPLLSQSALSQGPLLLAYARIALAKSRSKWAAWLSSQRLPLVISREPSSVISTERSEWRNLFLPPFVISTERSEWRNLDKMLIFNRFLDYALCAPLEMTIIPKLSPRFTVARGDPDPRAIHLPRSRLPMHQISKCFLLRVWPVETKVSVSAMTH